MARGIQQCAVADAGVVSASERALEEMERGLDDLVAAVDAGELGRFDTMGLVAILQRWERLRNRMPVVDHAAVEQLDASGVPAALAQPSVTRVLVSALRISSGEAHRRVKAAEMVGPRTAMSGERLEPRRPVLALAQRAGEVTPEQVQVITRALAAVDRPGFDPAAVEAGERVLVEQARSCDPKELGWVADQVVARIDPDGTLPDDRLVAARRHVSLRATPDGGYVGELRLTGPAGAKLLSVLRPLAKPRTEQVPDPDGRLGVAAALAAQDERTYGQRLHDALEDVCDRVLRSGALPDAGGIPATVIVTISEDDLRARVGGGRTADGTRLSVEQVLELAGQADVLPTVLTGAGAVAAQGRNRRIASPAQTWALVARDGGCSFPGCDRPPELCERHHLVPWVDGGPTDLDNLTLLCRWHHHQFERRGWTAALDADRLPRWTPPRWIDREQRPLLHARIEQRQLRLDRQPSLPSSPSLQTVGDP